MAQKRIPINQTVKEQLPEYVRDESPLVGEFLSAYYQGQEYQGGSIDIISNLDTYIKLNEATNLVGFTTLTNDVSSSDTEITVSSTQGFPPSYGLLKIDDEIVTYTGIGTTSFTGCIRGFSGITSFTNPDEPEEFLFSDTKAAAHAVGIGTSSGQVENLSILFIREFLRKSKQQFLPGFQKDLNTGLNQPQFIRHSKDFYNARGTDESFKMMFKSLWNENVDIIRPADYVISPSDANYRKTRDLIVEPIQGDPADLVNMTLFQDPMENLPRAYGPVSAVERIRVGLLTDTYFKVSIDASFGTGSSDELLYGNFAVHANSMAVGLVGAAQTYIDVDSTIGFPDKGSLTFKYKNGTTGIATYTNTNITQFLGVVGVTTTIKDKELIKQNTYVYAQGKAEENAGITTNGIRCRITGVLSDLEIPDTYYQKKGAKIKLKSLGKVAHIDDFKSLGWMSNVQTRYNIEPSPGAENGTNVDTDGVYLYDASNNTFTITTKDFHRIRLNEVVTLQNKDSSLDGTYTVTDVLSATKLRIRGAAIAIGDRDTVISITRLLNKPNNNGTDPWNSHSHINNFTANIQNVYMQEVGYAHTLSTIKNLVGSNSLPSFADAPLNPSTQKISLSGFFLGGDTQIGITTGTKDHNFFTGDAIYYTPQKYASGLVQSLLFPEGLYFVERITHNDIKLAKSVSNLYDGNYQKINEDTVSRTVTNNIFEKYDFREKILEPQKLFREVDIPVYDGKKYPTTIGYNGMLINGVEVLSYKSKDLCYYGTLNSVDVIGGGRYYDIINPPLLAVNDGGIGYGATGYVSTRGKFQEIRILDPGFDYTEVPVVSISGGNGTGADAECKLSTVPHSVVFNAGSLSQTVAFGTEIVKNSLGINTDGGYNVGFLTYHKFRNNERIVYDTFGEKGLVGLDTGAVYYVNTQQRYDTTGFTTITSWVGYGGTGWYSNKTIRLHTDLNECVAGVNTVAITGFGEGNHEFRSLNGKAQVTSIKLTNTGDGYENKQKTCLPVGINTALDRITILNHDYKSGEIVTYSSDPDGTAIQGLSSDNEYYIDVIDENTFRLATVGVGTTAKDFYYKTRQYENLRSVGVATHTFNYPPIKVEISGAVGISSIEGNEFKCIPQPLVRGEVTSVHLTDSGVGYGSSEILNFNRQPNFDLYTGRNGELLPIVANGKIIDVAINNRGDSYNTPPAISVAGVGTGAELVPEIIDGQIRSIKIIKGGIGYGQSTTALTVEAAGEFANLLGNIQTWQVNEVQKNYANIDGSDVFLDKPTQISRGLQASYAYAPRSLRKVLYQNDADGNALYGDRDLTLLNGLTEEDKSRHSPLIGWAYDGNPIYGPYGYEKSTGGNITQLRSGYSIDLKTNRPPTSIFPQEFFIEDFTWNTSTDEKYLDENNGRYGITPEYPKGTYAYFATFDTTLTSGNLPSGQTDPFANYKRPAFPYLIGANYDATPNNFNTLSKNNQDQINLNTTKWVRNTEPYEMLQDDSYYDYLKQSYKYITQNSVVKYAEEGKIDKVGIVTGGSSYQFGDKLVFEEEVADNFQAVAKVSKVEGPGIGTMAVTVTKLYNLKFYPSTTSNQFIGIHTTPIGVRNTDKVYISGMSTTSSDIGGRTYNIGISSSKLIVSEGIGTVGATGLVTYFNVKGKLAYPNDTLNTTEIRENDILTVGIGTRREEVKVLFVDSASNRLRVLRNQTGTTSPEVNNTGFAHSIRTVIEERPRKFTIDVGFNTSFNKKIDQQYYFDPRESLGLSTTSGVGIGTTVVFENPGGGATKLFVPARHIYLPNHKLQTGDTVIYNRNTGDSIGIATNPTKAGATNPYTTTLQENIPLYVAKLGVDFIGLSTVRVGLGTEGDGVSNDLYVGSAATTKHQGLVYFLGIGTGRYHSLTANYDTTITGSAEKNLVTVSTSATHGLLNNDTVYLTVDAGITTTVPVKYNKTNRKLIARTLDFTAAGITTASSRTDIPSSIQITNHELTTGQRVVHTTSSAAGNLVNDEEYFVYVVNKDIIKLCGSRFQTIQKKPKFVDIPTTGSGTLNLVNPPLDFYKNGTVTFDLSDSSLRYTVGTTNYPAFEFKLYKDSNFIHEYTSNELETSFEVTRTGTIGVDGKLVLKVNQYTPKILYYNLIPTTDSQNLDINKELVLDKKLIGNNEINIKTSRYAGQTDVIVTTTSEFTYDLDKYPEVASYAASATTKLDYTTTSKTAYGPIAHIALADKGRGYKRIPGISTVTTDSGSGAILEASSTSIGVPKTFEIENIGFDYPSDFTLRPQSKLPQIIKIEALSGFESIGITSYGRGYNQPPALVVVDGRTGLKVDDVDLRYNLETPDEPGYVDIIQNTYGLSNVTPRIVPVANPNGVRVTKLTYDSSTDTVKAEMKVAYSRAEEFPIEVGDRVFIENASVGVGSTGQGYDSQYYGYNAFEVTQIHQNLGNVGVVTYSMGGNIPSGAIPGNFDAANSSAVLVRERDFPQFAPKLVPNIFNANETLKSETSVGPVQGVAFEYNPESKWLTVEAASDFEVGRLIESLETGAKGNVSEIVLTFDSNYLLDYFSIVNNGWEYQTGFLNDSLQKVHDNEYYQSFSYAVKSRVFFDTWKDIVNTLTHTSGFRKFSQLQVESQLPVDNASDMVVGLAGTVTGIINIQNQESLHEVNNFDLVTENLKDRSPAAGNFSDEITFKNRILMDYAESVGNRVLKIDDLSSEFNSNPRPEPWSEVARYDIANNKENRFIVYVKDRLFTDERQIMMVNALFDPVSGKSMINQYGSVDTVLDLGSMDTVVDGTDAVLQFHPIKSEKNNYNVITLSYNLDELGFSTSLVALGQTTIGSSSTPPGALVSIGSSNVLGTGGQEVKIATIGTASTTGIALTTTSAAQAQNELYNPRSAKVIVAIATSEGSVEYDELSMIYSGVGNTSIVWHEYGQLAIHNRRDNLAAEPLGTFRPYVVGVGTTAAIEIGYTPNAGIQTAWINSITIGISSESFTGIGTIAMENAALIAKSTTIPSAGSPSAVGIASYKDDFDGAYVLVQVKDTTNDRYEFSEVMMVDDDTTVSLTEYGNLQAGVGAFDGLGTISGRRATDGSCKSELIFTPPANTAVEVKTFTQALKVVENAADTDKIELNSGSIQSGWDIYGGTFYDKKTEFGIAHDGNQIFQKNFDGSDSSSIVDLSNNTITIPNHYFVSGEEVTYSVRTAISCAATTGIGTTGDRIGIANTYFAGIGATVGYIPDSVFVIKVDDQKIKLARSAEDALKAVVVPLDLTTVGVGSTHTITSKNQNTRGLITVDNIIQTPVVKSEIRTGLSTDLGKKVDVLYFTGITSFYSGDDIQINSEIMKITAIGPSAGATNAVKVNRHWMGTQLGFHSGSPTGVGDTVTKLVGNYNIVDNTLNFSEAPFGGEPPVGHSTSMPNERDWIGITTYSSFSGRVFMRSGVLGSNYDAYTTNYVLDDLSQQFDGTSTQQTLTVDSTNVTGIATNNGIVMINGVLQGAGSLENYDLIESAGITSIRWTGAASSVTYDPNTATVPVGGLIVSVGSTEGEGYQPLVAAGATIRFASSGIVTSVSIGNTGSGYRVVPGPVTGIGTRVGIATEVKVGVALSNTGTPSIQYIGTAAVVNGSIVSIAVTYTDPVPGFPGTASSTFEAIIDSPLPYENIPLWHHSSSPGIAGTGALANVIVGMGGSVIDFEITNTGYGYKAGEILTLPTTYTAGAGSTVGIPTASNWDGDPAFKLTLDRVHHDEFSMWTMGEIQPLDDFSSYFDGVRKAFPITYGGDSYAIQAKTGSGIVIGETLILTINDVLQVPGEGFTFNGGGTITLTEAPKKGDLCNFFFYRVTGGADVLDRDIIETVKMGDDLTVGSDREFNPIDRFENPRTVSEVKSSDQVDTNQYYGVGLGDDATETRPVKWSRQLEDKYIDGRVVRKDRPLYEPNLFPTAYLLQGVGIGSTTVWVDNCKPFFDPLNENPVNRSFQKDIQIVNASNEYEIFVGAAATAIVSAGGTIQSIAIGDSGRGYNSVPTVTVQVPIGPTGGTGVGATPFVGIGTTAAAKATATVTNGVISGVTVTSPGLAYTHANPPQVLITPPEYVREENTIDFYEGDYGLITGIGTTSTSGVTTGITFDLVIPADSPLRDVKVAAPNAISRSGLSTGYYFMINSSNVGNGVTSLDAAGNYVGLGTTAVDNIYQVVHHVGVSTGTIGLGVTEVQRITVSVLSWNGLDSTVGASGTTTIGISSDFIGEYSWGKVQFSDRMKVASYTVSTNNGVAGIKTGPQIKRKFALKSTNYVV